jgi:hypothetical protein
LIDTLAYSYSWRAPKTLKLRPNVVVRLVTGPYPRGESACSAHAFEDLKCYANEDLREEIVKWSRLSGRIYIWDYIVNFRQYLLPLPNIHTFGPNIRWLVKHGVRGIFEQGSGDVMVSDMAPLKAYLVAKLLWNPGFDVERGTEEFLSAYYGDAAELMGEYLDLLKRKVEGGDYYTSHMQLFNIYIDLPYLSPEVLGRARSILEEAESRVEGDDERLMRVRIDKLFLDYIKLAMTERVMALVDPEERRQSLGDWYESSMRAFFSEAEATGVANWRATCYADNTIEDFRQRLEAAPTYGKHDPA